LFLSTENKAIWSSKTSPLWLSCLYL